MHIVEIAFATLRVCVCAKAGDAFGKLQLRFWGERSVVLSAKIAVYQAVVLSTLLYGCESWVLYRRQPKTLTTAALDRAQWRTTCQSAIQSFEKTRVAELERKRAGNVCLSVRLLNRLTFELDFFVRVGHDNSSSGIESQDHRSMSKVYV